MPSAAQIEAQLEQARGLAQALHATADVVMHRDAREVSQGQSTSDIRESVKSYERTVKQMDRQAADFDRKGDPLRAEEMRELAARGREEIGGKQAELKARAEGLSSQGAPANEEQGRFRRSAQRELETAADTVDDKVRLLEQALNSQKQAEANPNDPKAQAYASRAQAALDKAAEVKPDLSGIDHDKFEEAMDMPLSVVIDSSMPVGQPLDPALGLDKEGDIRRSLEKSEQRIRELEEADGQGPSSMIRTDDSEDPVGDTARATSMAADDTADHSADDGASDPDILGAEAAAESTASGVLAHATLSTDDRVDETRPDVAAASTSVALDESHDAFAHDSDVDLNAAPSFVQPEPEPAPTVAEFETEPAAEPEADMSIDT